MIRVVACPWAGTASAVVRNVIRRAGPCETTISSTVKCAGTVIIGGVTEPFAAIVKRAGTRALTAPVVPPVVVLTAAVVVVVEVCERVVGVVVWAVAVVGGAGCVVVVEVDFAPPQPARSSVHRRTDVVLTFAG